MTFQYQATEGNSSDITWSVDLSVWAGAGGGEEVSLFGFGEAFQAQVLAGFDLSASGSVTTSGQHEWGLGLSDYWVPPPPSVNNPNGSGNPPGVLSYDWRVYFLPPSARWREEFLQYRSNPAIAVGNLPNPALECQVDPTCQPWRVVFEVVSYTMDQGPSYPSPPGQAPVPGTPSVLTWSLDLQGGSGAWVEGETVTYSVSFFSGPNESVLTASQPYTITGYMCPELSLPVDSTGWASGRKIYRQFSSQQAPVLVGTILDNTTTEWIDADPLYNFDPPRQLGAPSGQGWTARSNYPNSSVWVPGNQVSYALTYIYPGGETAPGEWSAPVEVTYFAMPTLDNVPTWTPPAVSFPACTGRRLYRQCTTAAGTVVVAEVDDNTTTTLVDQTP